MPRHLHAFLLLAAILTATQSSHAQDPLKSVPNNYKLILDNPEITVIRVHYGPHERVPVHDHPSVPTIYVYLNDSGEVRLTHDETPPMVMTRPPTKTGSFRIAPGRAERHSIENLGDQPSDFLRVELKKAALQGTNKPVRGAAPDPLKAGITEEFNSPELTIHRVVCDQGPACTNSAGPNTLIVAFSSTVLRALNPATTNQNQRERQLQNGDIAWQAEAKTISIHAATSTPAQILEISLNSTAK